MHSVIKTESPYLTKDFTTDGKASALKGLLATDEAISQAVIKPPVVLPVNVPFRREFSDLPGKPGREFGGVEPVDKPDSAHPFEERLVVFIHVVPEDGDESHPSDDHPLLGIRLLARCHGDGGTDGSESANGASTAESGRGDRRRSEFLEAEAIHRGDTESLHSGARRNLRVTGRNAEGARRSRSEQERYLKGQALIQMKAHSGVETKD